jgi:hypothetical protein
MPIPFHGFWCDRRSLKFAGEIYKCPRSTCSPTPAANKKRSQRRQLGSSGGGAVTGCWNAAEYTSHEGACNSDSLLCSHGARGPLCGSCDDGFIYSSAERVCVACGVSQTRVLVAVGVVLFVAFFAVGLRSSAHHFRQLSLSKWAESSWVLGTLRQIDSGALRVAWSNYQVDAFCCTNDACSAASKK